MTRRTGDRPWASPFGPRQRRSGRLALLLLFTTVAIAAQPPDEAPLTVMAQARPTSALVGQTVDLVVGTVAGRERPVVSPPRLEGADLFFVRVEQRPLSVSGIGDQVWEQNLFRFRYRVVPRRAGVLTIPRVSARLGARTGASKPIRIDVREVPRAGRPATFLGGVGPFEVDASARPASVRTGETFEYRIRITGLGARGVVEAPALDRLAGLPLGLRVERRPDVSRPEPPSHTFVYRLRPTRSGEATLPPVRIAGFDPETGQYLTRATPGVPVRVTDVAAFDPARLDYGPAPSRSTSRAGRSLGLPGRVVSPGIAAVVLATCGAVVGLVRWRRGRHRALGRLRRVLGRRLGTAADPAESARAITDALAGYLTLSVGRHPGALTPAEAAAGIARATGREDLASEASDLLTRCDRASYGDGDGNDPALPADALAYLRRLSRTASVDARRLERR